MAVKDIPNLVKHCAVAIYLSGDLSGGKKEKFQSAWNIARSRLTEYGYLAAGSEDGPASKIQLTSKGHKREAIHASEPGSKTKSLLFDQMYQWLDVAQDTSPAGQPAKAPSTDKKEITGGMVKKAQKSSSKKKMK